MGVILILRMLPSKGLFTHYERGIYFCLSAYLIYHPLPCLSTGAVPTIYESEPIMTGWDEVEVRKK
jgi:hypothetical protein